MKKGVSVLLPSAVAVLGALAGPLTLAQNAPHDPRKLQLTPADEAAAREATIVYNHVHPARTDAGAALGKNSLSTPGQRAAALSGKFSKAGREKDDQLRFPGDLTFLGGKVVHMAESHPIFLLPNGSCAIATCWGDPEGFLADFAHSELAHITDQYVGEHQGNRYTLGDQFALSFSPPQKPLTDANIVAVVHAAAALSGESGYGHIFHVFLPPGQDECFTSADTKCYSPDDPSTFAFCAYHNSVDFTDIGHVLYTVEPFQNVPGCNVRPGTPNGQLVDSTNSTLSHELIETITDPDGDAWFNFSNNSLIGQEIADECQFLFLEQISQNEFAVFSDPTVFKVGRHRYAVQPEYSNQDHGCAVDP
jgi:hypothetical protein